MKAYEEKVIGLSKARGKGVIIGRRRTDKICLPMRMHWKLCFKVSFTDFAQHLGREKLEKAYSPTKSIQKKDGGKSAVKGFER